MGSSKFLNLGTPWVIAVSSLGIDGARHKARRRNSPSRFSG
jgi:hypothetical protein